MAKINKFYFEKKKHKKRKRVHSKNKSKTKGGPQYVKPYKGQGR